MMLLRQFRLQVLHLVDCGEPLALPLPDNTISHLSVVRPR